ncbi:MAG: beta-aspartyl-peptidase [Acidobacteria bacterium]|nr:MAG: beta-aspartyl-peptidase [Acidobacteriota bacterium]
MASDDARRRDDGAGLLLLRGGRVVRRGSVERCDLLLGGGRVLALGAELPRLEPAFGGREIDLGGRLVIPGLIDVHAHLTGGGGEAGPASRVPPLGPGRFLHAGTTTAIGLLGTDDVTRTPVDLLATTRSLCAEGLDAWCYTGGYHLPPATLTGSVRSDLVNVDRMVAVGEVAVSDHRSSQPTLDEILRLAADAHVAGLQTGKAGLLHLHLGDGGRGLELVRAALERSELPPRVFHPTHVNRRRALWEEACALTARGCAIDVTAFPPPAAAPGPPGGPEEEIDAAVAVADYLARGLPPELLTVSSDGGGCLPSFDEQGEVLAWEVGDPGELMRCLQRVVAGGVPIERAVVPFTENPARLFRLRGRGRIELGGRADLVVLREAGGPDDLAVDAVFAAGVPWVEGGEPVRRGRFEG